MQNVDGVNVVPSPCFAWFWFSSPIDPAEFHKMPQISTIYIYMYIYINITVSFYYCDTRSQLYWSNMIGRTWQLTLGFRSVDLMLRCRWPSHDESLKEPRTKKLQNHDHMVFRYVSTAKSMVFNVPFNSNSQKLHLYHQNHLSLLRLVFEVSAESLKAAVVIPEPDPATGEGHRWIVDGEDGGCCGCYIVIYTRINI